MRLDLAAVDPDHAVGERHRRRPVEEGGVDGRCAQIDRLNLLRQRT